MQTNQPAKNGALDSVFKKSNLYSNSSTPWQQSILKYLLSNLKIGENLICLDAACGIGNNIATLSKYFEKIIAFDISVSAIEYAKFKFSNTNNVTFNVGDLESIKYQDNLFDFIVCTEALEHIQNYELVIEQLYRLTKNDGYIILSFQNHFNLSGLWKYIYQKIHKENWDVWGTHRQKSGYESFLNVFMVKRVIKKLGFINIKDFGADYLNSWFFWLPYIYRNYKILDRYPCLFLGKLPIIKYFGMDYFILLKKHA